MYTHVKVMLGQILQTSSMFRRTTICLIKKRYLILVKRLIQLYGQNRVNGHPYV